MQQSLSDIDSIESQINNNATIIAALQNEINIINDKLVFKQNLVNGSCPDGSAIQQILTNGSVICEGVGGTSGQLQSVYAYNIQDANPNATVSIEADCPAIYTVTGAGFHGAYGWDILSSYTGSNSNSNNFAYLKATNNQTFIDSIYSMATCSRIVP